MRVYLSPGLLQRTHLLGHRSTRIQVEPLFHYSQRIQRRHGMSPAKKDRKTQSVFGKEIPKQADGLHGMQFASVIAAALHREFGGTHAAIKTVVGLTNANERAVKNWFEAKNGP